MMKSEVIMTLWKTRFTFAKTMSNIPHEWTCKHDWYNKDRFEDIVMFIRENGVKEKFYNKEYIYFYSNGYKYWTLGYPLEKTIIINRAKTE